MNVPTPRVCPNVYMESNAPDLHMYVNRQILICCDYCV